MDGQHYVNLSWTVFFYSTLQLPCQHGSEVPLAAVLARIRVNVVEVRRLFGSLRETGVDGEAGSGGRDRMVGCWEVDGEEGIRGEGCSQA